MRRPAVIITFFVIGACLLWLYFAMRLPPGIVAKGGTEDVLPWISLAGAFVSFLTGVATLGLKIMEIRLKLAEVKAKGRC